jgi:hypothetical protein
VLDFTLYGLMLSNYLGLPFSLFTFRGDWTGPEHFRPGGDGSK